MFLVLPKNYLFQNYQRSKWDVDLAAFNLCQSSCPLGMQVSCTSKKSWNVDFSRPKFDRASIKHEIIHLGLKTCSSDSMSTTVPPHKPWQPRPLLQYSKHLGISRADRKKTRRATINVPMCWAITLPCLVQNLPNLRGSPLCRCYLWFLVSCTSPKNFLFTPDETWTPRSSSCVKAE